jgi:16S rRNA (cytosine967-C5)-methyltransferase
VTPAARIAAAVALLEAIEAAPDRPADAVASGFFRERRYIGASDRRNIGVHAWTVLRRRRELEWWLARHGGGTTARLLVGASLLLTGTALAALERSFDGERFAPAPLSGDERAVLRSLEGHTLTHPAMPDAVRLEVPDWLLEVLRASLGTRLEAELAALAGEAPLDLRVNRLKAEREQVQQALAAEGIATEPTPHSPWGLRARGRQPVTATAAFRDGLVEIQDEGSQLVAALLGAGPGMRVADWCAGAGGKTLALAMTMQNHGRLVACDVSAPRLEGAVRRLRRAGVHNVERHLVQAGDKWSKRHRGSFERVLVDAPCTGTGTWRRNPDARLRLTAQDLAELTAKQAAILAQAAMLVAPGGRLVYATCSLLAPENTAQVERFLAANPEFALLPLASAWPFAGPPPAPGPYLELSAARHGTDGFFAAALVRRT